VAAAEPVGSKKRDESDVRRVDSGVVFDVVRVGASRLAAGYLQVDKGLAGVPVRRPRTACAIARVRIWVLEVAQALRLAALGVQSGRQLSVPNSEADKFVVLPGVTVLACAKLA
jgi:hypothetical protein